jgi:hypothetical protein
MENVELRIVYVSTFVSIIFGCIKCATYHLYNTRSGKQ